MLESFKLNKFIEIKGKFDIFKKNSQIFKAQVSVQLLESYTV